MQDLFAVCEVLVNISTLFKRKKQDQVKARLMQTDKYPANDYT
jgi:hypothetical protein